MRKNLFIKTMAFVTFVIVVFGCQVKEDDYLLEPNLKGVVIQVPLTIPSVAAVVSGTTVTVSWGAINNAVGYEIVFAGDYAIPAEAKTTSLSIIRSVLPGNYTVKVRALATSGDKRFRSSEFCSPVSFTILNPNPQKTKLATPVVSSSVTYTPAIVGSINVNPVEIWPPNNKEVTIAFSGTYDPGKGIMTISWDLVPNAVGYTLSFNGGSPVNVTSPFVIGNLSPGTYSVCIIALAGISDLYLDSDPGYVSDGGGNIILPGSATYTLVDEYGVYSYSASISGNPYSINLNVEASRLGQDMDGRYYTFTITSTNGGGASVTNSGVSIVPHDQR